MVYSKVYQSLPLWRILMTLPQHIFEVLFSVWCSGDQPSFFYWCSFVCRILVVTVVDFGIKCRSFVYPFSSQRSVSICFTFLAKPQFVKGYIINIPTSVFSFVSCFTSKVLAFDFCYLHLNDIYEKYIF